MYRVITQIFVIEKCIFKRINIDIIVLWWNIRPLIGFKNQFIRGNQSKRIFLYNEIKKVIERKLFRSINVKNIFYIFEINTAIEYVSKKEKIDSFDLVIDRITNINLVSFKKMEQYIITTNLQHFFNIQPSIISISYVSINKQINKIFVIN